MVSSMVDQGKRKKSFLSRLNRRRNRFFRELRQGYLRWIKRGENRTKREFTTVENNGVRKDKPLISILMPVYNPNIDHLTAAINSVLEQFYQNWELCIADDCSTDDNVRKMLDQYADQDSRIRVTYRNENGHISAASNTALAKCKGEFVALLDQDDLLAIHALSMVATVIGENPQVKIIYSDEDKFDDLSGRFDPYFKPCWNIHLFRSQNLISHLGVYSLELLREIGGFRLGLEGSQDYDLALRCVERIDPKTQIFHIPQVLYHWRVHPESTASGLESKPYASVAALTAIQEHLNRTGVNAVVKERAPGAYLSEFGCEIGNNPVAICSDLSDMGHEQAVAQCLNFMAKTSYPNYEMWVNKRSVVTELEARGYKNVRHIDQGDRSFLAGCEDVFRQSSATGIFLVDGVMPKEAGWLQVVLGLSSGGGADIVTCTVIDSAEKVFNAGYMVDKRGDVFFRLKGSKLAVSSAALTQQVTAPSSMAMWMTRRSFDLLRADACFHTKSCVSDVLIGLKASEKELEVIWSPDVLFVMDGARNQTNALKKKYMTLSSADRKVIAEALANSPRCFKLNPNYKVYKRRIILDHSVTFDRSYYGQ